MSEYTVKRYETDLPAIRGGSVFRRAILRPDGNHLCEGLLAANAELLCWELNSYQACIDRALGLLDSDDAEIEKNIGWLKARQSGGMCTATNTSEYSGARPSEINRAKRLNKALRDALQGGK